MGFLHNIISPLNASAFKRSAGLLRMNPHRKTTDIIVALTIGGLAPVRIEYAIKIIITSG